MTDMFIVAFNTRFACLKNTPKAALSEGWVGRFCPALPHVSLVSLDVSCVVQCGVEIAFNCIQEN